MSVSAARRRPAAFRWRLLVVIYISFLLYMLLQGGKTSIMIFCILNGLIIYLILGYWSGIRRITGNRSTGASGADGSAADSGILSAGTSLQVNIQLRLPGYYPVPYVLVRERLQRNGSSLIPFEVSFVPNTRRTGEVSYATPPLERGMYRFLPTECSTRDMFGFFEHTGFFTKEGAFYVRPRMIALRGWERVLRGARGHFSHSSATRASRETTQINGIREYLPGDRLSRIHWGATAKTGQWKSKEFEREALPRTIVLLDAGEKSGAGAAERFETAVSTAASLLQHGLRRGASMGLWSSSRTPAALKAGSGGEQLHRALELLTMVSSDGRGPLAASLGRAEPILEKGSFVIVVTAGSLDEVRAAMDRLSGRGITTCCIRIADRAAFTGQSIQADSSGVVYTISRLEELPAALDGREAAADGSN